MSEGLTPQDFVIQALGHMREEIECCKEHLENEDFSNIVMHMTNLALGCQVTAEAICDKILTHDQVLELLTAKLQEVSGMPAEYIGEAGGMMGFQLHIVSAPDDLSELDEEGESGERE